jgi:NADPH:quinone reductase-like Zn-dependent oxidoreductase
MKAAILKKTGKLSELSDNLVIENTDIPRINKDEVLIKLRNTSLNHRDLWIAKGLYSKIKLPVIPGSDGTGIVYQTGENVIDFNLGDKVIINPGIDWGLNEEYQSRNFKILGMPDDGTFAEYVKVNHKYVYKKPLHLKFDEAAGIPLAGLTAFRGIRKAGIKGGENILITGIGGGVAHFALLFCIAMNANVFVTSGNQEKIKLSREIGAKGGVNYNKEDWINELMDMTDNKLDIVIDGSGNETINKCIEKINYGGKIILYGASNGKVKDMDLFKIFWKQITIYGTTMGSDNDFKEMLEFVSVKKIKPVIHNRFNLDDINEAVLYLSESKQFGKVIIDI